MSERPLPEAIRGSWFLLPEKGPPGEVIEDDGNLLALHIDGRFVRYELSAGRKLEVADSGDFTFDGDFLILRGSNTRTYRVRVEKSWYWRLEGKKHNRRLYRGLIEEDEFFEADDHLRNQIARFPMRVQVDAPFADEPDAIFDLIYRVDGQKQRIGTFSVEVDRELDALWVGVTPLAVNLGSEVWKEIVAESYLTLSPHSPDEIERVTVDLFGTDEHIEFDVA